MAPYYYSHAIIVASVGDELGKRGHTVVMPMSPIVSLPQELNLTVHYYPSPATKENLALCTAKSVETGNPFIEACVKNYGIDLQALLNNTAFLQQLKDRNFEFSYGCQVVAEYTDIKIQVDVSPLGICEPISSAFHIPSPLAYVPQLGFTHQMNLYQRIINVITKLVLFPVVNYFMFSPLYEVAKTSKLEMETFPKFEDKRSTFVIANGDFAIDYPRPLVPSSKVVGPILAKPAKPLPSDLQHFISSNPNGTILVSFGTVVTAIKHVVNMQVFYQAFSRLPYNVLWKYTEDISTDVIANNVKIVEWLPQNDVLGNPQIKGFVTHCGYNSVLEAGYHGVPMVGTPAAGDQLAQASKITARNIGVILDIRTMTADDLYQAIITVTNDKDILDNITRISKFIKNRPNGRTPIEEAADWVEFALRSDGGDYLRTEEYNMEWYELYLLDVYAVIIIACYLFYRILKLICRGLAMLCCSKKQKVKVS